MQKGESWMDYEAGTYDIAVIGGGHAGIEASSFCSFSAYCASSRFRVSIDRWNGERASCA